MKKKLDVSLVFSRITSVFLACMASVFLLYTGENGFASIVGAKLSALWVICCVYFGAMIVTAGQLLLTGALKWRNPLPLLRKMSGVQWAVTAYLVLTWISALASPHFPGTIGGLSRHEGALTITIYCAAFLFVSAFGRAQQWLLYVFGGAMTIQNVIAIAQLFGANPFTLYPEGLNYFGAGIDYAGAYLGTVGNVDLLAAIECAAIPVFLVALLRMDEKRRFFLLIPLVTSLAVLIGMNVLAGFVGVGVGLVLTLPLILPKTKKYRILAFSGVLGAGIAAIIVVFFVDFGGFFGELHALLHGQAQDSFGSGRIYIWRSVLELVPQHLLLGAGPDTLSAAAVEPFSRYDAALGATIVSYIDTAHSEYLNILYHQGIIALAAYLAAIGFALRRWIRTHTPAADMLAAALVCYAIGAMFGISMCVNAPFFWLTMALLDRCGRKDGHNV